MTARTYVIRCPILVGLRRLNRKDINDDPPETRQMMSIAMDMFAYSLFFGNGLHR